MKALRKINPAPGADLLDLPVPEPGRGELLVKVKATALCRSDVDVYEWTALVQRGGVSLPVTMGHEFAGEVVKTGDDVRRFRAGDRVAAETHIPCGYCHTCRTGNRHVCRNGMGVLGRTFDGSFAEYIKIPEAVAIRVPDALSWAQGALLEPLAVAMHAMSKLPVGGEPIGILGVGAIGQMAVQLAAILGASRLFALDIDEAKLAAAKKMGADITVNGRKEDFVKAVMAHTDGIGLAGIVEMTGNARVINQGVEALRVAGKMVQVGMVEKPLTFENYMYGVAYKELVLTGIFGRRMFETWETLFALLESGKLDVAPYVGMELPFAGYEKAFELFPTVNGRIVLRFD